MDGQIQRRPRTSVEIPITITTVLDSLDASIVDLSERGAQVTGCTLPYGTRFQIEFFGQTIFAQCRWAEVDRMGISFSFPLTEGPLHERLIIARASQQPGPAARAPDMAQPASHGRAGLREIRRAPMQAVFGRRTVSSMA